MLYFATHNYSANGNIIAQDLMKIININFHFLEDPLACGFQEEHLTLKTLNTIKMSFPDLIGESRNSFLEKNWILRSSRRMTKNKRNTFNISTRGLQY
jgi:hypothetical protein